MYRSSSRTRTSNNQESSRDRRPPPDATLLAREVIQNSWDAARELEDELGEQARIFRITFRYEDLEGPDKKALIKGLGLDELAKRSSKLNRGFSVFAKTTP